MAKGLQKETKGKKPTVVRKVATGRANAGIRVWATKSLKKLVDEMDIAYMAELKPTLHQALIQANPKLGKLSDGVTPLTFIRDKLDRLAKKWQKKWHKFTSWFAPDFVWKVKVDSEHNLQRRFAKVGFNIDFQPSAHMKRLIALHVNESASLISNIPEQYRARVNTIITNGLTYGSDEASITEQLTGVAGITRRRAARIAQDQNNKVNQSIERQRSMEAGVVWAEWQHMMGGRHPRKDHIAANGRVYNLQKGCLISGEYIQTGQLPFCHCRYRPLIPGIDDKRIEAAMKRDAKLSDRKLSGKKHSMYERLKREEERLENWDDETIPSNTDFFKDDIEFKNSEKHHIDEGHEEVHFQHVKDTIRGTQRIFSSKTHSNRVILRRDKVSGFNRPEALSNMSVVIEHDNFKNPWVVTAYYCSRDPKDKKLWGEDD